MVADFISAGLGLEKAAWMYTCGQTAMRVA